MDLNCNLARTTRLTFLKHECCVRKSQGIPHACHVAIILRFAKEDFKIYFWAKFHLVQVSWWELLPFNHIFRTHLSSRAETPWENLTYLWCVIATPMIKMRVLTGTRKKQLFFRVAWLSARLFSRMWRFIVTSYHRLWNDRNACYSYAAQGRHETRKCRCSLGQFGM